MVSVDIKGQNIGTLPFLPIEDVVDAWIELKPTIPFDMDDFSRYFEYTWIGTTGQRALFRPSAWNHHDASLALLPRSSNMAEGWHNGFRSLVRCSNPTIWSFLDALKLEQGLTDQKIAERLLLHPAPPRSKKLVNLDNKLQEFINAYDNEQYGSYVDFLSTVSSILFLFKTLFMSFFILCTIFIYYYIIYYLLL